MADLTKTIEIIFGGKDDVSRTIRGIEGGIDNLAGKLNTATQPLADLTKGVLKTDAALAALVVGGMAYAIKKSSDFNESFGLISTSVSATGEDLAKYRDDILDYSIGSVKSLEDINASLYTAAQAGVKYTDSLGFIAKAEELAVANKADLNTTVDLLTGTMNAYGFKMTDLAHINDVFFQSTLIGKQTIDELGGSMGNVVGIAANSGVSFEELSAAIATLTAKGVGTEEAITQVKGVIASIISPSREASEAAKALGLNFSLTELNSKGFSSILSEIMTKTGGSKEEMVKLFSEVRAMNGVLQLTGDGMNFFNSALDQVTNSAGASEAAYKKMSERFTAQSQMVLNSAMVALISIGTEIEPIAAKLGGALANMFAGVKIGIDSGAFKPLFDYLDSVGTSLADWLNRVAAALPKAFEKIDFDKLIASFKNLGGALKKAFEAIFGDIDLTTSDGLAKAIQKVIDGIAALQNVVAGIIDSFGPFLSMISEGISKFSDADAETQNLVGSIMSFATQLNILVNNLGLLTGALTVLATASSVSASLGLYNLLSSAKSLAPVLSSLGQSLLAITPLLGGGFALAAGYAAGSVLRLIPGVDEAAEGFAGWTDKIFNWTGTQKAATVVTDEMAERIKIGTERLAAMRAITDEVGASVDKYSSALDNIPEVKETKLTVSASGKDAEAVKKLLTGDYRLDPLVQSITVDPRIVEFEGAAQKIDQIIPKKKTVDIEAKLETEKIKAQSDVVQKAVEWKAKVDISQIEAGAKTAVAAFEAVGKSVDSTGSTLTDLYKLFTEGDLSFTEMWGLEDTIAKEEARRQKSFDLQERQIESEIRLNELRANALSRGDSMITIDGAGLQPHLEAFMFEILSAIQIRANAEGASFLVGI
jgi:TP901 family phage tail tape measure protein